MAFVWTLLELLVTCPLVWCPPLSSSSSRLSAEKAFIAGRRRRRTKTVVEMNWAAKTAILFLPDSLCGSQTEKHGRTKVNFWMPHLLWLLLFHFVLHFLFVFTGIYWWCLQAQDLFNRITWIVTTLAFAALFEVFDCELFTEQLAYFVKWTNSCLTV